MNNDDEFERERRAAAAEWVAKLSRTSIGTDELEAFFTWRRDPANRRVWDAMEAGRKRVDRFVVRPETERFKVIDIWTGETAVIAMAPQQHMSEEDALHTARLLNRNAKGGGIGPFPGSGGEEGRFLVSKGASAPLFVESPRHPRPKVSSGKAWATFPRKSGHHGKVLPEFCAATYTPTYTLFVSCRKI